MPDQKRFHFSDDKHSFYLPETLPWGKGTRPKNPGMFSRNAQPFRVGWRCVVGSPYDMKAEVEEFAKDEARHTQTENGHTVHLSAQTGGDYGYSVVVDIWLEASANLQQFDLSEAMSTLNNAMDKFAYGLSNMASWKRQQDFIEVNVPKYLATQLIKNGPAKVIESQRSDRYLKTIETAQVSQDWLILGPEDPSTIEGVARYLRTDCTDDNRDSVFSTLRYPRVTPLLFLAALLLTWLLPLRAWSIVATSVVVTILFVIAILPARRVGWAATMRQTETVACLVFFGVSVFAIAYAICALRSTEALGVVDSLGYPFLVSTSVGIAGGVLGDPKGVIRVLIHLQLLLLVAALIKVLAILLRIEKDVRRGRE